MAVRSPAPGQGRGDQRDEDALHSQDVRIPIVAETATVVKRATDMGGVRVHIRPVEREEVVNAMLSHRDVDVERVAIDRVVTELPVTRREGDILIIPVVEERLVIETQLVLKEELRIRTTTRHEQIEQTVRLRSERVELEPIESGQTEPGAEQELKK